MKSLQRLFVVILSLPFASIAAAADDTGAIPMDKCVPDGVMVSIYMGSLNREVAAGRQTVAVNDELMAIAARYPNAGNRPIGEVASKADNARLGELFAISRNASVYRLGETRLQRDMDVFGEMHRMAKTAYEGGSVPKPGDPDANLYIYILTLRVIWHATDAAPPVITGQCNLDLALQNEDDQAGNTLMASPAVKELLQAKAKYPSSDGQSIDTSKMLPADARHIHDLQIQVGATARRAIFYEQDLQNLRRLAAISKIRYDGINSDLLQMAGRYDQAAFDAADNARYAALSPEMKKTWELWNKIDTEVPAQEVKDAQLRADIERQNPVSK